MVPSVFDNKICAKVDRSYESFQTIARFNAEVQVNTDGYVGGSRQMKAGTLLKSRGIGPLVDKIDERLMEKGH